MRVSQKNNNSALSEIDWTIIPFTIIYGLHKLATVKEYEYNITYMVLWECVSG